MTLALSTVPTPLGDMVVASHDGGVCAIEFDRGWPRTERRLRRALPSVTMSAGVDRCRVGERVTAYFEGDLSAFDALPLDPRGTPFDQRVWRELRSIPPGTTIAYRDLALRVGCLHGCRAVGAANGRNPLALAVPCHRVVGTRGELRGYAGGLERKRWLLSHEARFRRFSEGFLPDSRAIR
jgi:methylated-DNA-[protein]-cysteine S-methyltransferase